MKLIGKVIFCCLILLGTTQFVAGSQEDNRLVVEENPATNNRKPIDQRRRPSRSDQPPQSHQTGSFPVSRVPDSADSPRKAARPERRNESNTVSRTRLSTRPVNKHPSDRQNKTQHNTEPELTETAGGKNHKPPPQFRPSDGFFTHITLKEPELDESFHHLYLSIPADNWQKLALKRDEAIAKGLLSSTDTDYVNARLKVDENNKIKVKMRLKGDFADHLKGYKWSFRIKARGDNTVLGMKAFSIQHPQTRFYVREWLFHQLLKQEDVLHLRYMFVKVSINGKYLGLFALEEHFDKRLVEFNNRREGPILKFDETELWDNYLNNINKTGKKIFADSTIYRRAPIVAHRFTSIKKNPQQLKYFKKAWALLDGFRRGDIPAGQVFDIEKMAKFYAVSYLIGQTHGLRWHNQRFYYNPITARLEPIGSDAEPGIGFDDENDFIRNSKLFDHISASLFAEPEFNIAFIRELERIGSEKYVSRSIKKLTKDADKYTEALLQEFDYLSDPFIGIRKNGRFIAAAFSLAGKVEADVNSQEQIEDGRYRVSIRLINDARLPIIVTGIKSANGESFINTDYIVLPSTHPERLHFYQMYFYMTEKPSFPIDIRYQLAGKRQWHKIQAQFGNKVEEKYRKKNKQIEVQMPLVNAKSKLSEQTVDLVRRPPGFRHLPFIVVDDKNRVIRFKSGHSKLTQNLVLPAGYTIVADAGTHIELLKGANIISYSPVKFHGSAEQPVIFSSEDGSGQGIMVMNAHRPSVLKHVLFDNLSNLDHQGWVQTGAVVFHESPVTISDCQFQNNRSEDGLNIIRSNYTMENIVIENTFSDAFDADFSDGMISNSRFIRCGNDCIDVSGSRVRLSNINIYYTGDKGVSIGENSRAFLQGINITYGEIGIASKDLSVVDGERINLMNLKVGLTAYQKKPEYGPSSFIIKQLEQQDVDMAYLIETGSKLEMLDGKDQELVREMMKQLGKNKADFIVKHIKNGGKLN